MNIQLAMACAALLLAPSVALASDAEPKDKKVSAQEEKEKKDQNRIVCRKEKSTGSRVASKKVCMTVAQWNAAKQNTRQALERNQALRSRPDGG